MSATRLSDFVLPLVSSPPENPSPWRLSGYRLLTLTVIISLGTAKAIATNKGGAVVGNTIDWVLGIIVSAG
jgi:hypothetical protein